MSGLLLLLLECGHTSIVTKGLPYLLARPECVGTWCVTCNAIRKPDTSGSTPRS